MGAPSFSWRILVFGFLTSYALALSLLFTSPVSYPKVTPALDKINRSLVRVEHTVDGGQTFVCAGFVADAARGWVVTAKHCVDEGSEIFVDHELSEVIRTNDQYALLKITPMSKPPLEVRKDHVAIGEHLTMVGFGFGEYTAVGRALAGYIEDGDTLITDGPLYPGMSGGPAVDEAGRVVGVNQASSELIGIISGADSLRDFLKAKH
jgi:S1-C subfamily serine protease